MARTRNFDEQEVLKKALDYFWLHGYHASKMDDLIKHLGISRGSLYATFGKDKFSLFTLALDHYIRESQQFIQETLRQFTSVKEAFRHLLNLAVEEALAEPIKKGCFVVNSATELAPHHPQIQEMVLHNHQKFRETFTLLIMKAQAQGEISPSKDAKALAMSMFTFFQGLRVIAKAYESEEQIRSIIEPALTMLD